MYQIDERQLSLFDMPLLPLMTAEETIELLRMGSVSRMRAKAYHAGEMIQVSFFPIWDTATDAGKEAKKKKPSRAAQVRLNNQRAQDNFILYANNNFCNKDYILHLGFDHATTLTTLEDVVAEVHNYIKKVRRRHKKRRLPELRYMYAIEGDGVGPRYHVHMLISGDLDRAELETLWSAGAYPRSERLRPQARRGLTGLAAYITKGKDDRKQRWGHSRNLKLPPPRIADRKLSKAQAKKMAVDPEAAAAWFAKHYKGYTLDRENLRVYRSEYVPGVYIKARLYKNHDTAQDRRMKGTK